MVIFCVQSDADPSIPRLTLASIREEIRYLTCHNNRGPSIVSITKTRGEDTHAKRIDAFLFGVLKYAESVINFLICSFLLLDCEYSKLRFMKFTVSARILSKKKCMYFFTCHWKQLVEGSALTWTPSRHLHPFILSRATR